MVTGSRCLLFCIKWRTPCATIADHTCPRTGPRLRLIARESLRPSGPRPSLTCGMRLIKRHGRQPLPQRKSRSRQSSFWLQFLPALAGHFVPLVSHGRRHCRRPRVTEKYKADIQLCDLINWIDLDRPRKTSRESGLQTTTIPSARPGLSILRQPTALPDHLPMMRKLTLIQGGKD